MSTHNYTIVDQNKCANCAKDKRGNLSGVCNNCLNLIKLDEIVKIKDTTDKDVYSCGCFYREEGPYYCNIHNEKNCP